LSGRSIARYGDGELRVALGRKCVSQEADPKLAGELRAILADEQNGLTGRHPEHREQNPEGRKLVDGSALPATRRCISRPLTRPASSRARIARLGSTPTITGAAFTTYGGERMPS
jgi:hypothetical protein